MAQPMFGALGGMTPDAILRRLLMTGGQSDAPIYGQVDTPDQPGIVANQLAKPQPGVVAPEPSASSAAMAKLATAPPTENKAIGPLPEPLAQPPSTFPPSPQDAFAGAAGSSKSPIPSFMQSTQGSAPATPPPFTPFNFPPPAPYEPQYVPNAIPSGMHDPSATNPWERGRMASSAEDELRLRQQAAQNDALSLIRAGRSDPASLALHPLQPHEIAAMTALGGQQADNLFKGRQLAESSSSKDREEQLKALIANQQNQTQLGVADITGKAHIAGAQAAHSTAAMKLQLAGQLAAQGKSPQQIGGVLHSFESYSGHGPGGPSQSFVPKPGMPTPDEEVGAAAILSTIGPMVGSGEPGPNFKLGDDFGQDKTAKVMDIIANLKPGEQQAAIRELTSGRYGDPTKWRDNIMRVGGGAIFQSEPPIDPNTGQVVNLKGQAWTNATPPYPIRDASGNELFRFQTDPNLRGIGSGWNTLMNKVPYGQMALPNGRGVVSTDEGTMSPGWWANKGDPQVQKSRAAFTKQYLKMIYDAENQPQPK